MRGVAVIVGQLHVMWEAVRRECLEPVDEIHLQSTEKSFRSRLPDWNPLMPWYQHFWIFNIVPTAGKTIDGTYPTRVSPASTLDRTIHSLLICSQRSMALNTRRPTGTSRDVNASFSSSVNVNLVRNAAIAVCLADIAWLVPNQHWSLRRYAKQKLTVACGVRLPALIDVRMLCSFLVTVIVRNYIGIACPQLGFVEDLSSLPMLSIGTNDNIKTHFIDFRKCRQKLSTALSQFIFHIPP